MYDKLGPETKKNHISRTANLFYNKYMQGSGLDIGYKGSTVDAEPVLSGAIGVDTDYPNYDGEVLPFPDESQDYVFTSHVLEHIANPIKAINEWFRVLKVGGYLILIVPHQYLYEKKKYLPSKWNGDHKRFYTPYDLLLELEFTLEPNAWRLRHCRDNDDNFDYSIPPETHSNGSYEIECVIQKIKPPTWIIE